MKIFVKVRPNAKEEQVEKTDETHFVVAVKEQPVQGQANAAVAKALADFFNIAPSRVRLVSGFSAKQKTFEILQPLPRGHAKGR